MKARHRPRRHHGQVAGEVHAIAPDLLDRQLEASEPDQQWAAEFTYVWTGEGLPFVAMVFDLYSRRAVRWSMQTSMTSQLVMDALLMVVSAWPAKGNATSLRSRSHASELYQGPANAPRPRLQHEPERQLLEQFSR